MGKCTAVTVSHRQQCGFNIDCIEIYIQLVPRSKHSVSVIKTIQLMLCREIIAVRSQIHTNTLCGQNVGLLNVKGPISILILAFYLRLDLASGLLPS